MVDFTPLDAKGCDGEIITQCFDGVEPKEIIWLWPHRIARGKLSLIAGDPGLGKSLMTLDMAAQVSRGGLWPDNTPCEQGRVLLVSAEDDAADTIRPRLDAAAADVTQIDMLTGVSRGEGLRVFTLSDLPALDRKLFASNYSLVVIDPLSAYLGDGLDSHKNSDVRAALSPLADLAAKHGVAIVGVSHLNKGAGSPLYRVMGSLAFTAAARCVLAVVRDPEDEGRRLVATVKNNLGPDSERSGLAYRIEAQGGPPRVAWEPGTVPIDLVAIFAGGGGGVKRTEAEDWLRDRLADGPQASAEIERRADDAGISRRTLARAKAAIGAVAEKAGFGSEGHWVWGLPNTEPQRVPTPHRETVGTLRETRRNPPLSAKDANPVITGFGTLRDGKIGGEF